jgi:hypothetical protein
MPIGQLSLGIKAFFQPSLPEGAYFLEVESTSEGEDRIFGLRTTDGGMKWVGFLIKIDPEAPLPISYQPIVLTLVEMTSIDAIYRKVTEAITTFRVRLLSGTAHRTEDGGIMHLEDERVPLEAFESTAKEPE